MGQDRAYPDVNFSQLTEDTELDGVVVNEHVKCVFPLPPPFPPFPPYSLLSFPSCSRLTPPPSVQADHYKLIREIGAASTILLKNTRAALPLSARALTRLALLGSDAGPNPDGPNGCGECVFLSA